MEFNKIVGAILFTALSAMVISKIGDLLIPEEILAVHTTAPATTGPAPAKKPAETEPTVAQALAKADIKKGETIVKTRCVACHTWTKGGPNKVGPNLWGIVGRPKGSHPGYDYSSAMKKAGGKWTYANIYKFLHNPQSEVKGTKMPFHLSKWQLRADVIAFLRTQNDNPPPLPKPEPVSKTQSATPAPKKKAAAEKPRKTEPTVAEALAKADPKKGEAIVKTTCVACHTWTKGGPNRVGPNLWNIVGRPKGSHPGYDYSSAMKKAGGKWTYADIYMFLHNPQSEVKGTKMPFHLSSWRKRADVLAFLRTQNDNPPPLPKATPASKNAPAKKAEPKKKAAAEKPRKTEPTVAEALAKADPKKGETIVKTTCVACHTWTKGGANKIGPNLWGIVGRPKGSHPGYDYSSAMKKAGGKWTYADLYKFLHNPQSEVKGTKMPFHLSSWQQRADVLAFLRTQNDNPPPLPKAASASKNAPAKKDEPKKTAPEETK